MPQNNAEKPKDEELENKEKPEAEDNQSQDSNIDSQALSEEEKEQIKQRETEEEAARQSKIQDAYEENEDILQAGTAGVERKIDATEGKDRENPHVAEKNKEYLINQGFEPEEVEQMSTLDMGSEFKKLEDQAYKKTVELDKQFREMMDYNNPTMVELDKNLVKETRNTQTEAEKVQIYEDYLEKLKSEVENNKPENKLEEPKKKSFFKKILGK
ncbi:MAG: hypothetical protein U5L10_03170 [Candidatus Moranbacteria bacterium]|nr:hypothetical protein [Candidatus Moranbacteria bacterium]